MLRCANSDRASFRSCRPILLALLCKNWKLSFANLLNRDFFALLSLIRIFSMVMQAVHSFFRSSFTTVFSEVYEIEMMMSYRL